MFCTELAHQFYDVAGEIFYAFGSIFGVSLHGLDRFSVQFG